MINYDLAKKLKEVGFPQNPKKHNEAPDMWFDEDGDLRDYEGTGEFWYNPTLSELIEACVKLETEDENFCLYHHTREFNGKWSACFEDWATNISVRDGIQMSSEVWNSPEKAVANLYLKLHEK